MNYANTLSNAATAMAAHCQRREGMYEANQTSGGLGLFSTWSPISLALVLGLALCLIGGPRNASAQTTAQISGTIADKGGAVIADAQVKLTNADTGAVRTAQSDATGTFRFPELPVGPYRLEVSKAGFQNLTQSGIVLMVNTNPTIPVILQVGSVSQTVRVEENAAMVEKESNSVGGVIEPEQVVDLPLNDRQPTQLIALVGATVIATGLGGGLGSLDYPYVVQYSVAGAQNDGTNYYLDGASNMDYRSNIGNPMPFPDALQEFKVDASVVPANAGSRPGGVVSGITKSGTNEFHGNVFEFLRNGIMDADAYNVPTISGTLPTPTQDNLKRNQFGGVVGGPIRQDKLFFFEGFQKTTERQSEAPKTFTVPTQAMMSGDFRAYLSPTCQSSQQYLNSSITFQGAPEQLTTAPNSNMLLPAWLNTPSGVIASKVVGLFGGPSANTNPCGSQTVSRYQDDGEYQQVLRTDWQRTPTDNFFARYFIADFTLLPTLSIPGNILSSSGVGGNDRIQNIVLGDTHVISSNMISTARIHFNRSAAVRTANSAITNVCSLGMLANCPVSDAIDVLQNEPGSLGYVFSNDWGISENIGWLMGKHQLEFGIEGDYIQMNGDGTYQLNPETTFSSGSSSYTNNNLADFVTGNIDSFQQGNGQLSRDGQWMPALYVEDNWKMTHTFQLNLGIRWNPYYPAHNKYGEAADFNLANYNSNVISQVFTNAPPGVTFPGDHGFNGHSDTLNHALDFSPRVGIVWDPRGKGLESIRAGYGLYWDTSLMWNTMHTVLNPPWGNTLVFVPLPVNVNSANATGGGGLANPYYAQPGGNIFPTPFNPPSSWPFNANGAWVFEQQNSIPDYSQEWNLSLQKQVGSNWLFSLTYLGNKTTHMWFANNIDPDVLITAGMTAPGIVANNVTAGNPLTGSCTLSYQGQAYTFNPCNQTSTAKTAIVNGVNDESARKALNLSNPAQGYKTAGGLTVASPMGNGAYNGLLVSAQHRLANGYSINGNYTWSHCLDDGDIDSDLQANFQNPANPKANWGNCDTDRRQLVNLSLVAQTPKFASAWMERIVGNWSGSGIFTASTGGYASVTDGSDTSLIGSSFEGTGDRPNQVGNPFVAGTVAANPTCVAPTQVKTIAHWFNQCAYQVQPGGTFGNSHRNSLETPGFWNFDTAIWRTFPITERVKLDFRGEAFNVFNHPEWGEPRSRARAAAR